MPAFPDVAKPTHISNLSVDYSFGRSHVANLQIAQVAWTANNAIYVPLSIPWEYPVYRVWWVNGSSVTSTNIDVGIYTPGGSRIFSTGSTAAVSINTCQYVTVGTPFVLAAGQYYLAYSNSGTTIDGFTVSANQMRLSGLLSQSVFPLPASATFAAYTPTTLPVFGITRTSTGF